MFINPNFLSMNLKILTNNSLKFKKMKQKQIILVFLLTFAALSRVFEYNACNSTSIFNSATFTCSSCPTNMQPNPSQNIPTSCICKSGYYPDLNKQCVAIGTATCADNQYMQAFDRSGVQASNLASLSCVDCANNAFKNSNGTGCTSCGINMVYVSREGCVCSSATMTLSELGCFDPSLTSALGNLQESNSEYYNELKYLIPACYTYKDLLSCSYLVNLCIYSLADTSKAECKYFQQDATVNSYLYFSGSNPYYMPSGTFSPQSALNFKLITYLATGNYVNEKKLKLPHLLRCGMPSENSAQIYIGNNIRFNCQFNYNYFLETVSNKQHKSYLYELFIQGANEQYYQVPVYLNGGSKAVRRFFLEDAFTSTTSINVLSSMKIKVEMNTSSVLVNPRLDISYAELSVQDGKITPDSQKIQNLTYQIAYVYDLTNFWRTFIGLLVTINVLVLIQSLARTYICYINRQSPFSFFFFFLKFWSLWMFYFLLCISGYWFLFAKTTQQLFILIPDAQDSFYTTFYVLAALMGFFHLLTVILDKRSKLNMEVFMINWQKGQFKNSWRQIFIINSLAEFYTHRTISLFWMLLIVMFFLVGFQWDNHAAEVAHTNINNIYYYNPVNRMLLYFLGCSIFIIVGVIFKILRRFSVIMWPYPFEDFVDYCNVTNISFFFMKKNSLKAHYIHASIADRTEVTYKQINQAIRKGLNKTRTVANQHNFHEHQRMYTVYVCRDLEDKFNQMLQKIDKEEYDGHKSLGKKEKKNRKNMQPREQFIDKKLKPHLEVISREGSNRNKTLTESLFGMPPVDLRDPSALRNRNFIIFDSNQDIVSEVFPNGNEFQQIHTVIIIFLMFILATASIPISAFLTYFVDEYLLNGWISDSCREKLEKMTKVKEGFML